MLNDEKLNRLKNIEDTYQLAKEELNSKLVKQGYSLKSDEYHKESFGSRFCVWLNSEKEFAIRLIWDGRDSWFILEESPAGKDGQTFSWADLGIYPLDANINTSSYRNKIVHAIVNEINI